MNDDLIEAATSGNLEEVNRLIATNADVNAKDKAGRTSLHWASGNDHAAVVAALIAGGADVNAINYGGWTPLDGASRSGHAAVVAALIAAGADVNAKNSKNSVGSTPLHGASRSGHEVVVTALIAAGADVNATNSDGFTPLHWASRNGHATVAAALIAAKANVNAKDNDGRTSMHWASKNGHEAVATVFIAAGAHIDAKEWDWINKHDAIKLMIENLLSRRFSEELANNGMDIQRIILGEDGTLTPNGLDYAYGGVLPKVFDPVHWQGREADGLAFYEAVASAIPDDLKADVVAIDLTEFRRAAVEPGEGKKLSAVARFQRPRGTSPTELG